MGGVIMNENIDLTKILDGCPKGTPFYSNVYGKVYFNNINSYGSDTPIVFNYLIDNFIYLTKGGKAFKYRGECIVFPSEDQRDWSKFERFWDKPKIEKFDVNTLQPFDKVLARDFLSDNWMADFFERIDKSDGHYNVTCVTSRWMKCIPYNEETKHLLGTTDDCPEYYKWWEE